MKQILAESFERVSKLLQVKDKELQRLSKYLYQHDYLDAHEMDAIINGRTIDANKE